MNSSTEKTERIKRMEENNFRSSLADSMIMSTLTELFGNDVKLLSETSIRHNISFVHDGVNYIANYYLNSNKAGYDTSVVNYLIMHMNIRVNSERNLHYSPMSVAVKTTAKQTIDFTRDEAGKTVASWRDGGGKVKGKLHKRIMVCCKHATEYEVEREQAILINRQETKILANSKKQLIDLGLEYGRIGTLVAHPKTSGSGLFELRGEVTYDMLVKIKALFGEANNHG